MVSFASELYDPAEIMLGSTRKETRLLLFLHGSFVFKGAAGIKLVEEGSLYQEFNIGKES